MKERKDKSAAADGVTGNGPLDPVEAGPQEHGVAPSDEETEELDRLQAEVGRLTDRHLRLAAEFDNYRKRVERERGELYVRGQAELTARLLDALDDLQRVAHHADVADVATLLHGVQLVEKKFLQVLESSGLETIEAEGRIFDPATMEALASVPIDDAAEDDQVADVFQKGYRFKGHLIRPARVRVKQFEV